MRQYNKNGNEYAEDGKRYVVRIHSCRVWMRRGENYELECRLIRKANNYLYEREKGRLEVSRNRWLYLTPEALGQVEAAVEAFEEAVKAFREEPCMKAVLDNGSATLWFRQVKGDSYDCVVETGCGSGVEIAHGVVMGDMIHRLHYYFWNDGTPAGFYNLLENEVEKPIEQNPIYRAAAETGDEYTCLLVKLAYHCESDKDCRRLEELTGERILPLLPADFKIYYPVAREGIDFDLLKRSGYVLMHRPYFAMRGYTHQAVLLNPCSKMGVDAAPDDETPITFEEYLGLFE